MLKKMLDTQNCLISGAWFNSSGSQDSAMRLLPLRCTLGYNPSSLRDWNLHLQGVSEFRDRN